MSEYDGQYIKLSGDPIWWLVEDGERRAMLSMDEVYQRGLKPVRTVTRAVLEGIPVVGQKKARKKKQED
jgi:hypothetical protein